jgi:hypothetical protein
MSAFHSNAERLLAKAGGSKRKLRGISHPCNAAERNGKGEAKRRSAQVPARKIGETACGRVGAGPLAAFACQQRTILLSHRVSEQSGLERFQIVRSILIIAGQEIGNVRYMTSTFGNRSSDRAAFQRRSRATQAEECRARKRRNSDHTDTHRPLLRITHASYALRELVGTAGKAHHPRSGHNSRRPDEGHPKQKRGWGAATEP